jgi:hypothetical protein
MKCFKLATHKSDTPGFHETRRFLVVAAPLVAGALLAKPGRLLAAMDDAQDNQALDEFIATTEMMASALKRDDSPEGQDAYLAFIADAVSSVEEVTRDSLSDRSWKNFDPGVYLGEPGRNQAFFVVQFELAPNAFLPPHCHPKTSVCTLGLEGAATLRHFSTPGSVPDYKTDRTTEFLLEETRRVKLVSGTVSTLSEHRDNIHLFQASAAGARGVDVTTDYGGDGSFFRFWTSITAPRWIQTETCTVPPG